MEAYQKNQIDILKKELCERDGEVRKAASAGNELLKQNKFLNDKLEIILSENEALKQEKYSLQLDLDARNQTVTTQAAEIESQRERSDRLAKKVDILKKEVLAQKEQLSSMGNEKCDVEKNNENILYENQSLKTKIDILKNQVQDLRLKVESSENCSMVDRESSADVDVDNLKCMNNKLNDALAELRLEFEAVKSSEQLEKKKVEDLQEVLIEKNKELAAYSVEVEEAKEHAAELQVEVENFKIQQIDQKRKGNSVFGEIDDRRKIIEKEYKILAKKYEGVGRRYQIIKKELDFCKASMTNRQLHEHHMDILKGQLYNAKREVQILTNKLSELMKDKVTKDVVASSENSYLLAMHKEDEKKISQLEKDLLRLMLQQMADDDTISTCREELYESQTKLEEKEKEVFELKLAVTDHSLFKEPDELTDQDVSVREFDPNEMNANTSLRKHNNGVIDKKTNFVKQPDCNESHVKDASKPVTSMGLGSKDFGTKFDPDNYVESAEYKSLKTRLASKDRKPPKDVQCAQQ